MQCIQKLEYIIYWLTEYTAHNPLEPSFFCLTAKANNQENTRKLQTTQNIRRRVSSFYDPY